MFEEYSIIVLCSILLIFFTLESTKNVLIAIESQRITQKSLIIDTHIDTPSCLMNYPLDNSKRTTGGHFDFERASVGGLNLAFMSLFVPQVYELEFKSLSHRHI